MTQKIGVLILIISVLFLAIGCSKTPEQKLKDYLSDLIDKMDVKSEDEHLVPQNVKTFINENETRLQEISNELADKINALNEDEMDDYIAGVFKHIHPVMPKLYKLEDKYKSDPEMNAILAKITEPLKVVEDAIGTKIQPADSTPSTNSVQTPDAQPETPADETPKQDQTADSAQDTENTTDTNTQDTNTQDTNTQDTNTQPENQENTPATENTENNTATPNQ